VYGRWFLFGCCWCRFACGQLISVLLNLFCGNRFLFRLIRLSGVDFGSVLSAVHRLLLVLLEEVLSKFLFCGMELLWFCFCAPLCGWFSSGR